MTKNFSYRFLATQNLTPEDIASKLLEWKRDNTTGKPIDLLEFITYMSTQSSTFIDLMILRQSGDENFPGE